MNLREYTHDNFLKIIIDEDGDSYDVFREAISFVINSIKPTKYNFDNCYFNNSSGSFQVEELTIYLEYSNWTGTLIKTKQPLNDEDKQTFYKIAQRIITGIKTNN